MAILNQPVQKHNDEVIDGDRKVTARADDDSISYGKSTSTGETKRLDVNIHGSTSSNKIAVDSSADTATVTSMKLDFSGTGYMSPLVSNRNRVIFFDDFLGDLIEDGWNTQGDTGASANLATAAKYGVVTLTTDATDDDTVMIAHELNWTAAQGLIFETKLKVDVITELGLFIGLNDAKNETSPNLPVVRATTVSVATATNCVGFCFDTDSTSDTLFGTGVKAGTLIADQGASTALVAATYVTLRIEVSTAGAASFYVDGTQIGATTADAVTSTTALTPFIGMANRGAAAHVLTVDYVHLEGSRLS